MTEGPSRGLTVAITGASGYVAGRLIEHLAGESAVERILAFDVIPPERPLPAKVIHDVVDVRDPSIEARLAGVDVVVHLAFIMDPIHDESEMRDVNVRGSQNVFGAAARAGARKIVYTSSATVYGAHPNNDFPLTEDSPLRANLDFSYPAHKLEVEFVVRELREEHPDVLFTLLRPAIVFGPHVDNAWSHLLELPVLLSVAGYKPPMQFVHEDDVARALHHSVLHDLDGAYNLAPDDHLEFDEILEIMGKRRVELPEHSAFDIAERLWNRGLAEAPAGLLHYVMHPWVVSSEKLAAAGFRCSRSGREAFEQTAERARRVVRIGHSRMEWAVLKRGAVAGAGLTGVLWLMRRRRRAA